MAAAVEMGFPVELCRRAVMMCNGSANSAVNWLMDKVGFEADLELSSEELFACFVVRFLFVHCVLARCVFVLTLTLAF